LIVTAVKRTRKINQQSNFYYFGVLKNFTKKPAYVTKSKNRQTSEMWERFGYYAVAVIVAGLLIFPSTKRLTKVVDEDEHAGIALSLLLVMEIILQR